MKVSKVLIAAFFAVLLSMQAAFASVGYFVRPDSSTISNPVAYQTFLFNTTLNQLQVFTGSIWRNMTPPLQTMTASGAPGTGNDSTQGYSVGSQWFDTIGKELYVCTDSTAAAALWNRVTDRISSSDVTNKLTTADNYSDWVVSGLLGSVPGSSLSMATPAGVAYISGARLIMANSSSNTYTASKDTYDYLQSNGTINHVAVNNGASAPTGQTGLALQKVVTDGTHITSVTQLSLTAPLVTVGNALTTGQALNKATADGFYMPLITGSGNKIVATPADGSSGPAAARSMVSADLPIVPPSLGGFGANLTATQYAIPVGNGSTFGLISPASTPLTYLRFNGSGTGYEFAAVPGVTTATANQFDSGPGSGSPVASAFRYMVAKDYYNNPSLFQARVTAVTGVAVPTSDQTAVTSVYLTACNGNICELFDGTNWIPDLLTSDASISLSGDVANTTEDIFAYDSSGTVTLSKVGWKSVVASNNPAAGSSVSITLADTTGAAIGDNVTVKDGSHNETVQVTAVVSNTSVTVNTLANSYTTPTVYYNSRTANGAIDLQDGIPVQHSDHTRRLVSTIRIGATTGQTEDSAARRYMWNVNNRVMRSQTALMTGTWNYTTNTIRAVNSNITSGQGRCSMVVGLQEDYTRATLTANYSTGNAGGGVLAQVGIGLNSTTVNSAQVQCATMSGGNGWPSQARAEYTGQLFGFNFLQWQEQSEALSTTTWYGTGTVVTEPVASGMIVYSRN